MTQRSFVTKGDLPLLLVILLLAVAGLAFLQARRGDGQGAVAEVLVDGAVVLTVPLSEDRGFAVPGKPQVQLEVRDGRCGFVHSDCPDQICVLAGFQGTPGQSAACLPNRVLLRIAPGDRSGADAPDTIAY